MRKRKTKISQKVTRLLLITVCFTVLLTGGISVWNLVRMKQISLESSKELGQTAAEDAENALEKQAGEQLRDTAQQKAAYINEKFSTVESYVNGIAALAETIYEQPQDYPDRKVAYPKNGSHELAAQLLFSADREKQGLEPSAEILKLGNIQDVLVQYNAQNDMVSSTYLATESGWVLQADYIAFSKYEKGSNLPASYEAKKRQWYQNALSQERGEVTYSDIIQDAHGGGACIVCAQPVYYENKIVAVVGVGSYLETVNNTVLKTTIGKNGYAFLINQKGQVVVSPKKEGETAVSIEKRGDLRDSKNLEFGKIAADMVAGNTGFARLILDGQEVYMAYAPLTGLSWSFCTVMPVEDVIAPARESQQRILDLTDQVTEKQNTAIQHMFLSLFLIMSGAFLIVGLLGTSFSRKITSPLGILTEDVARLSGGNLDVQIKIATGDEVEDLANAFNQMTRQLKEYIENLAAVTAEKERIRTELKVASKLQADMLPDASKILAGQKEFCLHAFMTPAKEVGGDFYDFFLLDQNHLALVVADVSGKGVPAALFMVVSRTVIRSSLSVDKSLEQTVEEINYILCRDNHDGMFVTAWLGILDLVGGELTYVNAGHCHPLIKRKGSYQYLTDLGGMMLAGFDDSKYREGKIQLQPGDMLYQYSDGVTEAHSEANALYEEENLQKLINEKKEGSPKEVIETVWQDLERFRGRKEQFDDITMLAICFWGRKEKQANVFESHFPALEKLPLLTAQIEKSLQGKASSQKMSDVLSAVDEIYANICNYSQASWVECSWSEKESILTLLFEDDGVAYDPLKQPDPNIHMDLEEREIGGLGIYLVKKQMDEVKYEYREGKNCLKIIASLG